MSKLQETENSYRTFKVLHKTEASLNSTYLLGPKPSLENTAQNTTYKDRCKYPN